MVLLWEPLRHMLPTITCLIHQTASRILIASCRNLGVRSWLLATFSNVPSFPSRTYADALGCLLHCFCATFNQRQGSGGLMAAMSPRHRCRLSEGTYDNFSQAKGIAGRNVTGSERDVYWGCTSEVALTPDTRRPVRGGRLHPKAVRAGPDFLACLSLQRAKRGVSMSSAEIHGSHGENHYGIRHQVCQLAPQGLG
jgi:hypothetical protein